MKQFLINAGKLNAETVILQKRLNLVFNHLCTSKLLCITCINIFFFRVIDGWETLDELEKLPVKEKSYRPLNDVKLQTVTIHANPIANGTV